MLFLLSNPVIPADQGIGWMDGRKFLQGEKERASTFGFYSGFYTHVFFKKESRMHAVLNEVYLQKILGMGVTFRDESNDGN